MSEKDVIIQIGGQSIANSTDAKRELYRIPVGATARYVAVRARDAAGAVLGTSPARRVGS